MGHRNTLPWKNRTNRGGKSVQLKFNARAKEKFNESLSSFFWAPGKHFVYGDSAPFTEKIVIDVRLFDGPEPAQTVPFRDGSWRERVEIGVFWKGDFFSIMSKPASRLCLEITYLKADINDGFWIWFLIKMVKDLLFSWNLLILLLKYFNSEIQLINHPRTWKILRRHSDE